MEVDSCLKNGEYMLSTYVVFKIVDTGSSEVIKTVLSCGVERVNSISDSLESHFIVIDISKLSERKLYHRMGISIIQSKHNVSRLIFFRIRP